MTSPRGRETLTIELDERLTGDRVAEALDRVGEVRGLPEKIRVDNGREFTGKRLDQWAYLNHVRLDVSRRGKPSDGGLIEAFDGTLRAECLNENWFMSMDDARLRVEAWRRHYIKGGSTAQRPGQPEPPGSSLESKLRRVRPD
jgi:putative transposase